ncbi:hypothetical protein FCU94_11935 [Vibrio sp. JPW-9-11-11]|nr:hypothetical protein [Vibrio sp. JPW-9-11-11]
MTVAGIQPLTTDRYEPTTHIYLGTTPPQNIVLELRLHNAPTWAVLLFCKIICKWHKYSPLIAALNVFLARMSIRNCDFMHFEN